MSGEELNGVQKPWGVVCEGSGEQTTGHFQEKEGPSQKGLARPLGAKSSVKGTCKDIIEVLEAFLDVFISIFFYLPFFFFFLMLMCLSLNNAAPGNWFLLLGVK